MMREHGYAEVQAIGASAINQAVKAATIARGYLEQDGIDIVLVPSFTEVEIGATSGLRCAFSVFKRPMGLEAPANGVAPSPTVPA